MKNKQNKELAVCGIAAVQALVKYNSSKITRLYFTVDRAHLFGDVCKEMSKRKAPYNQVNSETELKKLCGSVHHQGVVAMIAMPEIEQLSPVYLEGWVTAKESVLVLDNVGNANNFGAIVRSAAFFGIKNIVIPLTDAQTSITTSSYRVAQGGMELVSIFSIASIPTLLEAADGKMIRLGTDVHAKTPISKISKLCRGKAAGCLSPGETKPSILILGNEEYGISQSVKAHCDHLVKIPSAVDALDSLNVAQAAAIILYEMGKPEKD